MRATFDEAPPGRVGTARHSPAEISQHAVGGHRMSRASTNTLAVTTLEERAKDILSQPKQRFIPIEGFLERAGLTKVLSGLLDKIPWGTLGRSKETEVKASEELSRKAIFNRYMKYRDWSVSSHLESCVWCLTCFRALQDVVETSHDGEPT